MAIVGSAPSVLDNDPGYIDAHDIVVRINNYKLSRKAGHRTDVHYSFYGSSIKKDRDSLVRDGVRLCMCKCPNGKPIHSPWHEQNRRIGTDFRYIYQMRKNFWFCPVYIPTTERFLEFFHLLSNHIPTTGFQAILEISSFKAAHIYITGFDFFQSKIHNVNEPWRPGRQDDPIRHLPHKELEWLKENKNLFELDECLNLLAQG